MLSPDLVWAYAYCAKCLTARLRLRGYGLASEQRAASRSANSPDIRLTTMLAPPSISDASRPDTSTLPSIATLDPVAFGPGVTPNVAVERIRVPPMLSLPW